MHVISNWLQLRSNNFGIGKAIREDVTRIIGMSEENIRVMRFGGENGQFRHNRPSNM